MGTMMHCESQPRRCPRNNLQALSFAAPVELQLEAGFAFCCFGFCIVWVSSLLKFVIWSLTTVCLSHSNNKEQIPTKIQTEEIKKARESGKARKHRSSGLKKVLKPKYCYSEPTMDILLVATFATKFYFKELGEPEAQNAVKSQFFNEHTMHLTVPAKKTTLRPGEADLFLFLIWLLNDSESHPTS